MSHYVQKEPAIVIQNDMPALSIIAAFHPVLCFRCQTECRIDARRTHHFVKVDPFIWRMSGFQRSRAQD